MHRSGTSPRTAPMLPPPRAANTNCVDVITGYSTTYGVRNSAKLERFSNQTAQWKAKGPITKINAYYSPATKCVAGIKITYGESAWGAGRHPVHAGCHRGEPFRKRFACGRRRMRARRLSPAPHAQGPCAGMRDHAESPPLL